MKNWVQATRLRTLPLSISGIIMGSFIARWKMNGENWSFTIFILALFLTILYQILSNFANDYGDGIKGTDKHRSDKAELRAVASGRISAKQMKKAMIIVAITAVFVTGLLIYIAFSPNNLKEMFIFLFLGILSILAAIGYTVGEKPYGYLGLGDIMVFLFFGILSVGGSYFLFTKVWDWQILLPATAVGMLSASVLNLNNMRDIESDAKTGKKTLAIRLGYKNAMIYQMFLMQLPHILLLIFIMKNHFIDQNNWYAFIPMIMVFPLAGIRRSILQTKDPKDLDPFLKQVGVITLVTVILFAFGLNWNLQ